MTDNIPTLNSRYKKFITIKEAQSYACKLGITISVDTIRTIVKKQKIFKRFDNKGKIFVNAKKWENYLGKEGNDYNETT